MKEITSPTYSFGGILVRDVARNNHRLGPSRRTFLLDLFDVGQGGFAQVVKYHIRPIPSTSYTIISPIPGPSSPMLPVRLRVGRALVLTNRDGSTYTGRTSCDGYHLARE